MNKYLFIIWTKAEFIEKSRYYSVIFMQISVLQMSSANIKLKWRPSWIRMTGEKDDENILYSVHHEWFNKFVSQCCIIMILNDA